MGFQAARMHIGKVFLTFLFLTNVGFSAVRAAEHLSADVIIIGAGIAGITAGQTLSEGGKKDILILEATNRIGGRLKNYEFAGEIIELGANWVEGVDKDKNSAEDGANPIWLLAKEVDLKTSLSNFDNLSHNIYDSSGLLPAQDEASDLMDYTTKYAEGLGEIFTEKKLPDISVLVAQRLCGGVPSTPVEMVFDYFTFDGEFAEPPRVTSLKNTQPNPTFENFGPDMQFVHDSRGYSAILDPLSKYLKEDAGGDVKVPRVKLEKVVRKIVHSNKGVKIYTEDGSSYKAKAAIITVSVGVLQTSLIEFKPDLPFWKLEALFSFDMATYMKIFLKFPKTFWPTGNGTDFFLYADKKRGYYPIWQHLESAFPGKNMVFVTVTDDEAARIEAQPEEVTKSEIMAVLKSMFPKVEVPPIDEIYIPKWKSDRFFKGTFSNWPIGVDNREFENLQEPYGRLHFAGEHTSRNYNGYVHGGYYSGLRVARNLLASRVLDAPPARSQLKAPHQFREGTILQGRKDAA